MYMLTAMTFTFDQGEGLMMLALKFVQRKDLDEWIKQERSERLQAQVRNLKQEMVRHREEGLARELGKPIESSKEGAGANAEQSELLVAEANATADAEEAKRNEEVNMKAYIVTGAVAIIVCLALVFVIIARQYSHGRRRTYVRLGSEEGRNLYENGDESEWSQ